MRERTQMIAYLRGEITGPAKPINAPQIVTFEGREFTDVLGTVKYRSGALAWLPRDGAAPQEILYYRRENPHRKYGVGLLSPEQPFSSGVDVGEESFDDRMGIDLSPEDSNVSSANGAAAEESLDSEADIGAFADDDAEEPAEQIDVTSTEIRHPSAMGISFCATLPGSARLVIALPSEFQFAWQDADDASFAVNGRYEECARIEVREGEAPTKGPAWRRVSAVDERAAIVFEAAELRVQNKLTAVVTLPDDNPMQLSIEAFARSVQNSSGALLVTIVLRSGRVNSSSPKEAVLFQSLFTVHVEGGAFVPYPETGRTFALMDPDEQSLALLYQDSATWAVGHGCAAAWTSEPGETPSMLYADVMPTVETPSMTPDIRSSDGRPIQLKMLELAKLPDSGSGAIWDSLEELSREYRAWILRQREIAADPSRNSHFRLVADRHLNACDSCCLRIDAGIALLRQNSTVRRAFRLANRSMLLQQVAAKHLTKRRLEWDPTRNASRVAGNFVRPSDVVAAEGMNENIGTWRAFQMAFLLTQLVGMSQENNEEREIVDLIWFPTGGGKTEAYLAVVAYFIFHQRLTIEAGDESPQQDGTNVLMRYTLRLLTTQQFQRAASLICAMEMLRRNESLHEEGSIAGERFALGLWFGGAGSPNNIKSAKLEIKQFEKGKINGNPLVITECPWCRAEIGRCAVLGREGIKTGKWILAGIDPNARLHCSDARCDFGGMSQLTWLPIEVIDDCIYDSRPSLIIATVDKFAMLAFRPLAGAIFGRRKIGERVVQEKRPPGLIIQDELHLIAGPLGTMYGLYEGFIESLCSYKVCDQLIRPKIIASTATIRGADEQVKALYARVRKDNTANLSLFPPPGLSMGDSFFGVYKREASGRLESGRLYLGIHATEFGSVQTTQVRAFSAALCRAKQFATTQQQDPWWTLLAFYNSLRELGGAKTLFDSDIRSRLKFLQNREGLVHRTLRHTEELTSRLSQAEIVGMLERLSTDLDSATGQTVDACLASSIIEVGVDIDRLSLMAVVGQPKTTAQYIQVTGRVGRRWWERPGLILTVYSPSKSRDRSHFEQFHTYHRRLYELVEPTSATPFAPSVIQRALAGALLMWARQHTWSTDKPNLARHQEFLESGLAIIEARCRIVQSGRERDRSLADIKIAFNQLRKAFDRAPAFWERYPPSPDEEYLMLWPGEFYDWAQERRGVYVQSSMRQVDSASELTITSAYLVTE